MNIPEKTRPQLEILISTMHRTTLGFLEHMFKHNTLSNFHLLIINQTTEAHILESDKPNIRVINFFEHGLSKSRNLAISNSMGHVALIADDDLVFIKNFERVILEAYQLYDDAVMISFTAQDLDGKPYRNYPNASHKHTDTSIKGMMSIELTFKPQVLIEDELWFDERFGLGAEFETSEEYLFVKKLLDEKKDCYFVNQPIVSHAVENSGKLLGSDTIIYARAALNYQLHKSGAYMWLFKYLFFLIRHKYITLNEVKHKWNMGLAGINDYIHPQNN